ncbi:MAG: acyltransferase [Actinomycetes bacterium]
MRRPHVRSAELRDRRWTRRLVRQTERALMPPPASAFKRCPPTAAIVHPARISLPECIELGDQVLIHENVWLELQRLPGRPDPRLVMGDTTMLNRFVKIVCLGSVTLGRHAVLGDRVYVSDVEYEPGHADVDPMHRPLTEPQPVVIGDNVMIGVGAVVKPGVTIGADSYVGAGAVVDTDVPPRSLVVGAPGRVVRQYNPDTGTWDPV